MEALKVLGQLVPAEDALEVLYTVPNGMFASISSISVCNQNSQEIGFRIAVAVGGEADDPKQYLYFDVPLNANDTFVSTIGITLSAGDVIRVRSDEPNVSFSLFGVEVS